MSILSIVLQVILGIGFIMFGYQKFTSEAMKQGFEYFGYSDGFRLFTGFFEIASAIVILVGIWVTSLATVGGAMIVVTMIGAIMTHVKMKDPFKNMMMPILLLVLGAVVTALNWSALF
ncbi:DoxX family protein [Bacillus massiliigorillae]|uniref:DoxX family protein n=1 Tax=Bacillus massiliigorillae TaxID=1243664 RepID=UPI0003A00D60|nr:DoxX family protein [Bacillus massiliigorillae]